MSHSLFVVLEINHDISCCSKCKFTFEKSFFISNYVSSDISNGVLEVIKEKGIDFSKDILKYLKEKLPSHLLPHPRSANGRTREGIVFRFCVCVCVCPNPPGRGAVGCGWLPWNLNGRLSCSSCCLLSISIINMLHALRFQFRAVLEVSFWTTPRVYGWGREMML